MVDVDHYMYEFVLLSPHVVLSTVYTHNCICICIHVHAESICSPRNVVYSNAYNSVENA